MTTYSRSPVNNIQLIGSIQAARSWQGLASCHNSFLLDTTNEARVSPKTSSRHVYLLSIALHRLLGICVYLFITRLIVV
jgi:hypothetical protein